MHDDFWFRMLGLLAVVGGMFVVPVVVLWRDGRAGVSDSPARTEAEHVDLLR